MDNIKVTHRQIKEGLIMAKKILVMMLIVLLVPVFSHASPVTGVTDTEVTIGITVPLSGPAAVWGIAGLAAKAWANYINDKGGIHGRKINVIMRDNGYNPARALADLTEMKGKVFAVTFLLGTAICHTTKDFFAENKIPLVGVAGDVRAFEKLPKDKLRWIFAFLSDYRAEGEFLTEYAIKNLGAKKISIFYQNDELGKIYLEGSKLALSNLPGRASLVATIPYDVTERALAIHAIKLRKAGADTLMIYGIPVQGALILKEIAKIGYRPKVLTGAQLGDPLMYKIAGADVWEGVYAGTQSCVSLPGEPEADRIIEILKKYEPKTVGMEFMSLMGAVSMMHTVEGLKNAGRNLTPETMIKGMEMMKNWKPEGMGAPVTYGPNQRHGQNAVAIMRAIKGKHVRITDYKILKPLY